MAATETQDSRILGDATIAELAAELRGGVIRPGDDGYDTARALWNGAHDRRPELIVRSAGVADVIAALRFARSQSLEVAVRGGGHSIAGFAGVDGGLVIDLSPMRGVRIDPEARRAYVQGGCVWRDVDLETQLHGLATTGGLVSTTGVGGYTLGRGQGLLIGHDRRGRLHARRRDRLADAQARAGLRQPGRGGHRHGRRRGRACVRDREPQA